MLLENQRIVVVDPTSTFCGREGVITRVKHIGENYADWRPIGCILEFKHDVRIMSEWERRRRSYVALITKDVDVLIYNAFKTVDSDHILKSTTIYFNPEDVRVLN